MIFLDTLVHFLTLNYVDYLQVHSALLITVLGEKIISLFLKKSLGVSIIQTLVDLELKVRLDLRLIH